MKSIFPIYLATSKAEHLVMKHAQDEFLEGSRFHSRSYRYEYSAKVLENGDVELHVHYSFDEGFCMGSGGLLDKTIHPYTVHQLAEIKRAKMLSIAAAKYEAQQMEKRVAAILEMATEMFKGEFDA